ncbi:hypothetical protein QBZ16_003328 [Prototheca wickerhamii]|uniref:Uncharacterized protein n=1 Tax=Prototheca wickerhamii TaxID=3111 RepID=A0AAD9IHR2_PROWI|nr:hypothetical protein QBZ16_003328 [Prototheca wickerhamii]
MTNAHLVLKDPHERLAAATREFGEYGGVNASIETSATFTVLKAGTLPEIFAGTVGPDGGCYLYGRCFNPTTLHLGRQLAALEGAEAGYCTSSGLAAINAALLALVDSGDHIIASDTIYGGTHALLHEFYPRKFGIGVTAVSIADLDAVRSAIIPGKTRVIYAETLSNPTLVVADIPALAAIAREFSLTLVVDNTFTPAIVSPIALGADVVVHSVTKFISGAADVVAGAIVGRTAFVNSLMDPCRGPLMLLGPTMDPKLFAERLEALGARVRYPGLASHPQHALFKALANPGYGAGGMLTLDLRTPERAAAFMERLQNRHGAALLAVSLGYFDTLVSASAGSTSSELSDAELDAAGISRGLVRLSVGYTGSAEQRWAALEESYRAVASVPEHITRPIYKAALHRKDKVTGARLKRTPSWHTFGSDNEDEAHEARSTTTTKAWPRTAPWVKVVDEDTEVEYVPLNMPVA